MPKVSVIIPTYNRAETLQRAIYSVLNQTYTNFELLVVDDGSTDDTKEVVTKINDSRICYIFQRNQERSVARNNGIRSSTGDYVSFLDSDDEYLPHKLEVQVPVLNENKDTCMVLGGWLDVDNNGIVLRKNSPWNLRPELNYDLKDWLFSPPVHFCTSLVRREWLERTGGFDPCIIWTEDVDLWFRMIRAGCQPEWVKTHVLQFHPHIADLSIYEKNYQRILDKAFTDTKLSDLIGINKDQAFAILYVELAFRAYLFRSGNEGQSYLIRAGKLDPSWINQRDEEIITKIVSFAWNPVNSDPVGYVEFVFNNLPYDFRRLNKQKNWILSRAWMAQSFRTSLYDQHKETINALLLTIKYEPSLIFNKGILSLYRKSTIRLISDYIH